MKLADIEQFDAIGAARQFFVRRRRARRIETIRDNANAVFFANLADQHRRSDREKRAKDIFSAVFGAKFADLAPWQRQLAYDVLAAREDGQEIIAGLPLRSF